jgi:oligoribonuclease
MSDHSNAPHKNLAWLDLETTGLRAREDAILELGVVITNFDLDVIAELSYVVNPTIGVVIHEIDPFVFNMHSKSGLWDECFGSERVYLPVATEGLVEFMDRYDATGSPMCGNTINFDRAFAKEQIPKLNEAFHYRNIDVSTLKNVMRVHFPDIAPWKEPEKKAHRVIADLNHTIEEYGYYLDILDPTDGQRFLA